VSSLGIGIGGALEDLSVTAGTIPSAGCAFFLPRITCTKNCS